MSNVILSNPPKVEASRDAAARNEIAVLAAIAKFGHCRQVELAISGWQNNPRDSAEVLAGRAIKRLLGREQILERRNNLPGRSYVLRAAGVARLRDAGIHAVEGTGLDLTGPHIWHRILGTRYLLERAKADHVEVWGEYAFEQGRAPLSLKATRQGFGKLPDGLVATIPQVLNEQGEVITPGVLDWIEIEGKFKRPMVIRAMLKMATYAGRPLNSAATWKLGRVVIVYDRGQQHEKALVHGLRALLASLPTRDQERVLAAVAFVRVDVELPLAWKGHDEITGESAIALSGVRGTVKAGRPETRKEAAARKWKEEKGPGGAQEFASPWSGSDEDEVEYEYDAQEERMRALGLWKD
jgi:hypothetical protein